MKFKTLATVLVVIILICFYVDSHIRYWRGTEQPDALHTHSTTMFGDPKLTEHSRGQRYLTDTDYLIFNVAFAVPVLIFAGGIVWFVREARKKNELK